MVYQIVVLGRIEAAEFDCQRPRACISISGDVDDFELIDDENRIGLLQIVFEDIESPLPGFTAFADRHAHDILDFVTEIWDKAETLMIHCEMGRSRSPAVAAALSRLKFGDAGEFVELPYTPNELVYRTLLEVAGGREDYAGS